MFKMNRRLMVLRPNGPAVFLSINLSCTQVDHWFNGKYQAFFHLSTASSFSIIRHLRIFMHASSQAMAYQFPYYSIAMFSFCVVLDRKRDISYPVSGHCFFYSLVQ